MLSFSKKIRRAKEIWWDYTENNKNNFTTLQNFPFLEKNLVLATKMQENILHFSKYCVKEKELNHFKSLGELRLLHENTSKDSLKLCEFCLKTDTVLTITVLNDALLKINKLPALNGEEVHAVNLMAHNLESVLCNIYLVEEEILYSTDEEMFTKSNLLSKTTVSIKTVRILQDKLRLLKNQQYGLDELKKQHSFYDLFTEKEKAYLEFILKQNKKLQDLLNMFLTGLVVGKCLEEKFKELTSVKDNKTCVFFGTLPHHNPWPNNLTRTTKIKDQAKDDLMHRYWDTFRTQLDFTSTKVSYEYEQSFTMCVPLAAAKEICDYLFYLKTLGFMGTAVHMDYIEMKEKPSEEVLKIAFSLWENNSYGFNEYEQILNAALLLAK